MTQVRSLTKAGQTSLESQRILFAANGVPLWPMDALAAYKRGQVEAHPANWVYKTLKFLRLNPHTQFPRLLDDCLIYGQAFFLVGMCVLAVYLISGLSLENQVRPKAGLVTFNEYALIGTLTCGVAAALCAGTLVGALIVNRFLVVRGEASWRPYDLTDNRKVLPLPIQALVARVRTVMPHARIRIHELIEPVTQGILDPIITVDLRNDLGIMEPHAFGVWDEQGAIVPIPS